MKTQKIMILLILRSILMGSLNVVKFVKAENAPDIEWSKVFGGTSVDYGCFVQQDSSGGYVILGYTWAGDNRKEDILLIKTDSNGNTLWEKYFGWDLKGDFPKSMKLLPNGNILIGGYSRVFDVTTKRYSTIDSFTLRIDSNGNKIEERTFGIRAIMVSFVYIIDDGSIELCNKVISENEYGFMFIKRDYKGNIISEKILLDNYDELSWDARYYVNIYETDDSGFIFAIRVYNTFEVKNNLLIIKTDSNGNKKWERLLSELTREQTECNSIYQTSDGGYVLTGNDMWLLKIDGSGNKKWFKEFGGDLYKIGNYAKECNDGGIIIVGFTEEYENGRYNAWLIKTDSNGNKLWDKTYGGFDDDIGFYVQETPGNGYIFTGYTESYSSSDYADIWLVKVGGDGDSDEPVSEEGATTFSDLSFEPEPGVPGGEVIITVDILNEATSKKTEDIEITVNDEIILSESITLESKATAERIVKWTPPDFGNYLVKTSPGGYTEILQVSGIYYQTNTAIVANYGSRDVLKDMVGTPLLPASVTSFIISTGLTVGVGAIASGSIISGVEGLMSIPYISGLALSTFGKVAEQDYFEPSLDVYVYDNPIGGDEQYYSSEDLEIISRKKGEPIICMIILDGGEQTPSGEKLNFMVDRSDTPGHEVYTDFDIICPDTYYDEGFFVIYPKFASITESGVWDVHISHEGKTTGFTVDVSEEIWYEEETSSDSTSNDTPGFEVFMLIIAIVVIFLVKKKV